MPKARVDPQAKPERDGVVNGPREDRGVLAARIIAVARASFAEHGWSGTTLRAVARDAGVDSALVHYYFGSKEALLEACTTVSPRWIESVRLATAVPLRRRGVAVVRNVMWAWTQPEIADVWRAVLLTAADAPRMRDKLVQIVAQTLVPAVTPELPDDERMQRGSLAAANLIGVVLLRYVWCIEPLTSLSDDDVVALVAPTIQHYLTGRLQRA